LRIFVAQKSHYTASLLHYKLTRSSTVTRDYESNLFFAHQLYELFHAPVVEHPRYSSTL